jgi:hypothetical protein
MPSLYLADLQAIIDLVQVVLVGFFVVLQQRVLRTLLGGGLVRRAKESPGVMFAEHARPVTADVDEIKMQAIPRRGARQPHAITRDAVEETPRVHVQAARFAEPAVQKLVVYGIQ